MGDAVGACADTMTVRPHRPNIVMKTGFLIVQASEATQPDPTTRMLTLRLDTFYSFWTLNSIGPSAPRSSRGGRAISVRTEHEFLAERKFDEAKHHASAQAGE